ncbi:unnamed protein product [Clonostachys chloroleuca]|uniref:Protein transport protein sec1 n=1 Tax=Clonostachys chloroleuca TaxID=1926264 RepID=A0AA35Q094_9HYPO|nr:unnamed protein product [Clonostachys chloroleuca]
MAFSVIDQQRDAILQGIQSITRGDWKCLVVDTESKKIIDNAVKEDDILNNNIATIEKIEDRREPNPEMEAIYILSPEPHIVDCLLADFDRRRYKCAHLLWTSLIDPSLRRKIDDFPGVRQLRASSNTLFIDFYPREASLLTFRDPWSFPILYHKDCDSLVATHLKTLAQKIAGVCITLGEYPKVRYWRPREQHWDAAVLCTHLASFVQQELDTYAHWNNNFPPQTGRPQASLIITDRAMDVVAPLVHEFTYQAMAHDLLPVKEGDKITYRTTINKGMPDAEEKDLELSEKDKLWVENRHRHMKDTIDKLMGDFRKFIEENPHFTNENADTTSLSAIRDMLAGLPQFQELKEAYSLHLTMAQECMNIFQNNKLPDIAAAEQTMATGLDEDYKKPKNVLDSVVRLLDEESISYPDRLRLIVLFVIYRNGVILEDVKRLLAHASLPQADSAVLENLRALGCQSLRRDVKEPVSEPTVLFPKDTKNAQFSEEYSLSRFDPVLKDVIDATARGVLDQIDFPFVKPPSDPNEDMLLAQGGSLRAGRPNWASGGRRPPEKRQRILVFMAGGATYSESRACYQVGNERAREVILATSHMITPQLYIRQLRDLSRGRRQLDLPADRPKPKAPAHLFERPKVVPNPAGPGPTNPSPHGGPARRPVPLAQDMSKMTLGSGGKPSPRPIQSPSQSSVKSPGTPTSQHQQYPPSDGKHHKEKKLRNFLGMKKS